MCVHVNTHMCTRELTHIYAHPEHTHTSVHLKTNMCSPGTRTRVHWNTHVCTREHTYVYTWETQMRTREHTHNVHTCNTHMCTAHVNTHIYARAENTDTHECSSDNKHVFSWNTTVCLIGTQTCVHVNTHMCTREHTHIYAHPEHTHECSSENKHVFTWNTNTCPLEHTCVYT